MKNTLSSPNKYIVFNTTNKTLVEKLHSSVFAFIFSKINGWEFRINDTEGIRLVEYYTSKVNWWSSDWKEIDGVNGRLNLLNIDDNNIEILNKVTFNNTYKDCNIVHLYSGSDLLNYLNIDDLPSLNEVFLTLFNIEDEFYDNFISIYEKLIMEPHLIMNVDDLSHNESKKLITSKIKEGKKIFLSGGESKLVREIKTKFPRYQFKSITTDTIKFDDVDVIEKLQVLSMVYQIHLMVKSHNLVICNRKIDKFIKDLHIGYNKIQYEESKELYEFN